MKKVMVSWSGGKDSYWALHTIRQDPEVEVVGLLSVLDGQGRRIALTDVIHRLIRSQGHRLGLPVREVRSGEIMQRTEYVQILRKNLLNLAEEGVTHLALGDIHIEENRDRRIRELEGTGIEPMFPNWRQHDGILFAKEIIDGGVKSIISSVADERLGPGYLGREYDQSFIEGLPEDVDPSGEHGEFHTFVYDAPAFENPIRILPGQRMQRENTWYIELFEVAE